MKVLGFDIGIASIGWAFVEDNELKDCGVRLFSKAENPKTGESLALPRREARGVRRRLDRRKRRLLAIKQLLCKEFKLDISDYLSNDGILPKAYQTSKDIKNPYQLRSEALEQKLDSRDLARVILHIAKHRGYGNKHTKASSGGKDDGVIKKAIAQNKEAMQIKGYKSAGEYLYKEFYQQPRESNPIEFKNVRNKKESYEHCLSQDLLKEELELILKQQKEFGFNYSDEFISKVINTAFYQRDLKDFSDKIGHCVFFENEKRAAKDSLSALEFVLLTKIINTLKNIEKINQDKNNPLASGEVYGVDKINEIFNLIMSKNKITYKDLRNILALDSTIRFKGLDYTKDMVEAEKVNFIDEKSPKQFKNFVAFKKALGEQNLKNLKREDLDEIATLIAKIKSKTKLLKELQKLNEKNNLGLDSNVLENLSNLDFKEFINLSFKALDRILPLMREGVRYDEAVQKAGLKESIKMQEKAIQLPPFCESVYQDELTNPVVHRAISEYRKVLNALLKKYGEVHKIHIELTREVGKNYKTRNEYIKKQEENLKKKQEALKLLEQYRIPENHSNILKARLFIEQNEHCIYSGKKITQQDLSDEKALEIDHIYPYSRSFDDSYMNKVLVFTKENQNKREKTPFEAFGSDSAKWEGIKSRALAFNLPKQKLKRILNENFKDKEEGFLARNLNDTSYIARLILNYTKNYLCFLPLSDNENTISGEKGSKVHVEAVSGMLSQTLRHYFGLGEKDRDNYLHHAIDAVIIAYTNTAMIKAFSDFKKRQEQNRAKYYAKQLEENEYKKQKVFFEPCENFRNKVLEKIENIFVSKPPRKRVRGALHEESFYNANKFYKEYGGEEGVKRALELGKIRQIGTKIVANGEMKRIDIFQHKASKKFYGVPIYTMDFALGILPNKAVAIGKEKSGVIKDWIEMNEEYCFCFSLFKDDLLLVQKKEMKEAELCYFVSFGVSTASIQVVKHNNKFEGLSDNEKLLFSNATPKEVVGKSIGIQNLKIFKKYKVSPLGEVKEAEFEERQPISLPHRNKRYKKQGLDSSNVATNKDKIDV